MWVGLVEEAEMSAGLAVVERVWYQEEQVEGSYRGVLLISEGDEGATQTLGRRFSNSSTISGHHITTVAFSTESIVDIISPSFVGFGCEGSCIKIDEFMSSLSQPVAALHSLVDRTSLAIIQRVCGEDV